VATLALMCDPRDLGQTLGDGGDDETPASSGGMCWDPTIFVFDNVPGGVGLAERIHERGAELVSRTRQLVVGCPCADGCPLCVGATAPSGTRKRAALRLLELILHS